MVGLLVKMQITRRRLLLCKRDLGNCGLVS
jgi:hypothetical protein